MRSTTLRLSKGTVATFGLRLRERPVDVTCMAGLVWATVNGSPTDHLLQAEQTARFDGGGRVVIQALRDATVRVERGREPEALVAYPPGSRTMSNTPVAVP